jgi:Putative rhamnosyl transferase
MLCGDNVYRGKRGAAMQSAFHVVVTRYNLAIPDFRARVGISSPSDSQRWLDTRLRLFKSFCLPSMLNQTTPPHLWILGFDGESRDAVAPVLEAVKDHPWIVPAWQKKIRRSGYEDYKGAFVREILLHLTSAHSHVILTRLDSDDSLGRGFLNYVSRYSSAVCDSYADISDFWIFFPMGADYFKHRCWLYVYPGNQFSSRVLTREAFLTESFIFRDHSAVTSPYDTVFLPITTEPVWLHTRHGGNVGSGRPGDTRRIRLGPTPIVLEQFGVKQSGLKNILPHREVAKWFRRVLRH